MINLYKIPSGVEPLQYFADILRPADNPRTAVLVPTNRNLRRLAAIHPWQLDIQTISTFTRRANLYGGVLLPQQLRSYYLYLAVKELKKSERELILRSGGEISNYMNFLLHSSALLPFFRELSVEQITTEQLDHVKTYHDYQDQITVLSILWKKYLDTVRKAGFIDQWECYSNPRLDANYLARYDNYVFLIGGFLNKYEIAQLKTISAGKNVALYFNYFSYKDNVHHQSDLFLTEFASEIKTAENDTRPEWLPATSISSAHPGAARYIYLSDGFTDNGTALPPASASYVYGEIAPCTGDHAQYDLITRRILREHLENNVPLERMAVVLPSPAMLQWFLMSDEYRLYNVSAGMPLESFEFYQALQSIYKLIKNSGGSGIPFQNAEELMSYSFFRSESADTFLCEQKANGRLYFSSQELAGSEHLGNLYRAVKPFIIPEQSYTDMIHAVSGFLKSIGHALPENDIQAWQAANEELEKMAIVYRNIHEPLPAIQLMGAVLSELSAVSGPTVTKGVPVIELLESRNMQYDILFIPNMNADIFPAQQSKDLFLNSEIRQDLSLPTFADRQELQKNYYLQLIACCKKVLLTYNHSDEKEASIFISEILSKAGLRMDNTMPYSPRYLITMPERITLKNKQQDSITKTPDVLDALKKIRYSATSLNTYRRCQIQFYFKYVQKLFPPHEVSGELEMRDVGIVLDTVMYELHNNGFTPDKEGYLKAMNDIFDDTINKKYDYFTKDALGSFQAEALKDRFGLIARQESDHYIQSKVTHSVYKEQFSSTLNGISFVCELDRLDYTPSGLIIIDYKYKNIKAADGATGEEDFKDPAKDIQMPLYTAMAEIHYGKRPVQVLWFDLKRSGGFVEAFNPELLESFKKYLDGLMNELLSPGCFTGPADEGACEWCDYNSFCPFVKA